MSPEAPARYAVIGNPIGHSLSPRIHAAFASQTGDAIEYGALLAPHDGFLNCASEFIRDGGRGLNVTLPFKRAAFMFAARHSPRATRAGVVNTLGFDSEGIWGDNTDGIGLVRDLARLNAEGAPAVSGARIVVLGAGGAVHGILGPLIDLEPAAITIANRDADKAAALCRQFGGGASLASCALHDLSSRSSPIDILIHATSLSLTDASPELGVDIMGAAGLVYDLSYAPGDAATSTEILRRAHRAGAARTCDGLGMLVEQAAEAFFVWRGVVPDTAPVLSRLRRELVS